MTDSHDEIMDLLGAYALDAVDGEEREAVEAHLRTCPRCSAEVADHREVAAMLAHSGAPAPEGIWQRIQDSLEETPPDLAMPVTPLPQRTPAQPSPLARRLRLLAAAAAVLAVGLVTGLVVADDDGADDVPALVAPQLEEVARRAFNDPEARTTTLVAESGDLTAPVAIQPDGTGYLLATSLPSLDDQHTYQLWGIHGDVVVSLGVLGPSPGVVAFSAADDVDVLAITREVAGGVVASENPPLLVGELS